MRVSKGKYIFSYKDTWNLDKVFNEIIHAGLIKFKSIKRHGYPNESIYDYYTRLGYEHNKITEMLWANTYNADNVVEFWEACLDKMIFAFQNHPEYCDIEEPILEYNFDRATVQKGSIISQTIKDGYTQSDADAYKDREKAYDEDVAQRIKEGKELFFKYYDSLWD